MKKRFLCTIASLVLLMGMTVYASDGAEGYVIEAIDSKVSEEKAAQLEKMAASGEEYGIQTYASDLAGLYEDNDTIATAYPYDKTKKNEHKDGEYLGHYNCYYAYTLLETADDVDYFKVNVRTGIRYVAALKNVWSSQVRDMKLYYQDSNGTWWSVRANDKIERQTIFHFVAKANTYYIEISGEPAPGYKHDDASNWFAVAPDGTIDERPHAYSSKTSCSL